VNNGLPSSMNQGNNTVQNINQNSVPNNVAQQIVQQSNNNSANVGDGLPSVPNQNNGSSSSTMSQWFINHMAGRGEKNEWGDLVLDSATISAPASMLIAPSQMDDYSNVKEDIPDFGAHGHSNFTGDWARKANDGTYYRPTSANNWR
jgi:hypothetical protein